MSEQTSAQANLSQWYILRGEMKYGPYEYGALLHMIQTGELYDYNYVWASHLENWMLLGDMPEFSKDQLVKLIQSQDSVKSSFIKRGSPRLDVDIDVYAHNDYSFFDGKCTSISDNGALVLLNDPLLLPGQEIMLHFRTGEKNPQGFNVKAEVIRKNFSKERLNVKSGLHYAVRFLQVQKTGQDQIQNWIINK
ncbi:MAG: DUF4339 domain-containing protein [Proteobacteria bacterium]|nr:MAG: DUF4339 domain-containing protein [Pseudomonadota bacterium]